MKAEGRGANLFYFFIFQFFLFNRTNAGGALIISVLSLSSSFVSSLLFGWFVSLTWFQYIIMCCRFRLYLGFLNRGCRYGDGRGHNDVITHTNIVNQRGKEKRNIIITVCFRICSDSRLFIPLTAYTRVGFFFSLFPNSLLLRLFWVSPALFHERNWNKKKECIK